MLLDKGQWSAVFQTAVAHLNNRVQAECPELPKAEFYPETCVALQTVESTKGQVRLEYFLRLGLALKEATDDMVNTVVDHLFAGIVCGIKNKTPGAIHVLSAPQRTNKTDQRLDVAYMNVNGFVVRLILCEDSQFMDTLLVLDTLFGVVMPAEAAI